MEIRTLFIAVVAFCIVASAFSTIQKGEADKRSASNLSVYKKIYGASQINVSEDGAFVLIISNGVPDHPSVYHDANSGRYESFSGTTFSGLRFRKNPNAIAPQRYRFKIPLHPTEDASHRPTPLGPIGIALNGVPFFNQYAGPNQPLSIEAGSFDQYWGHPARRGDYHYHVEPLYLTNVKASKSALMGFLLDGYPVYGPEENGVGVTNEMLDGYHGHTGVTADYSDGIYHYHITNQDPYINGAGFYGAPGTVSR